MILPQEMESARVDETWPMGRVRSCTLVIRIKKVILSKLRARETSDVQRN